MKFWLKSVCLIAMAIVATLISGIVHGRLSHRWSPPAGIQSAAAQLTNFPRQIGPWKLEDFKTLPAEATAQLQCAGYVNGIYRHELLGDVVNVVLLLGPVGPMSVHTPEVCYSNQEYAVDRPRERVALEGGDHAFWSVTLRSTDVQGRVLRVYYASSDGGVWRADNEPRIANAGRPFLYKLQAASYLPPVPEGDEADASLLFLQDFCAQSNSFLVDCPRRPSLLDWKHIQEWFKGQTTETARTDGGKTH